VEFPYQSLGFGESFRFPEVLQGQEMSQAVPFYQGTPFDARTENGGVGSFGYVQRSAAPSGFSSATQGYPLGQVTPSAPKVSSPSSVLMFNQVAVPQFELEGRTNYRGGFGSQYAPGPLELAKEMETWPCTQRQPPSEIGCRRFDSGNASAPPNIVESRSATGDIGRSSCRLFGFSLTNEKIQGAGDEDVKGGSSTEEGDRADPRVLDLFGYTQPTPSALHALVAAPLGM
jgi:auxin response factor